MSGMSKVEVRASIMDASYGMVFVVLDDEQDVSRAYRSWDDHVSMAWWLPTLGPTAMAMGRLAWHWNAEQGSTVGMPIVDLAAALGLGKRNKERGNDDFGAHHPVFASMHRLLRLPHVHLTQWGELTLPLEVPEPRPQNKDRYQSVTARLTA